MLLTQAAGADQRAEHGFLSESNQGHSDLGYHKSEEDV